MAFSTATLTVADVMTRVKRQFGDEAGVQITDADIIRWINDGQRDIALKNKLLRTKAEADMNAGQQAYGMPVDVMIMDTIRVNGVPIEHMSFQEAIQFISGLPAADQIRRGTPQFWYEYANELNLYPIPDTTVTDGLVSYYIRAPVMVTTSTDTLSIPDYYFTPLMHYVLQQAYEMDDDWTGSSNKSSQYESSLLESSERERNSTDHVYASITILEDDAW